MVDASAAALATVYDGQPGFDEEFLPLFQSIRCFRLPTDEEVERSFAAYQCRDPAALIKVWQQVAEPSRVHLRGPAALAYRLLGRLPATVTGLMFLYTLRAVLAAGVRFRQALSLPVQAVLRDEFPWLCRRHEHVPSGYAPWLAFPDALRRFVDAPLSGGTLDDARARWQLLAAINEVQQSIYSAFLATHFRLPALRVQALRERELALNYFAHSSPACTLELWRQCLIVLDGLNAAVFQMTGGLRGPVLLLRGLWGGLFGSTEWKVFERGLDEPQWLLPADGSPRDAANG